MVSLGSNFSLVIAQIARVPFPFRPSIAADTCFQEKQQPLLSHPLIFLGGRSWHVFLELVRQSWV